MIKVRKGFLHALLAVAFLALGVQGLKTMSERKAPLEKHEREKKAPVVLTTTIKTGVQEVRVHGEGTVRPLREINLASQVAGKVIEISPALVNGGEFAEGDILLKIDPLDYQLAVTLALAKVKDAESGLRLAQEESAAAREEWRSLYGGGKANKNPPPLVVKQPQLAAAQAALDASKSDLHKARLALARTTIKAPFTGRVSQKMVDIGQYVVPGSTLAVLFSTEAAEIVIPLEDDDLFWFYVPGFTPGRDPGSPAVVRTRFAGRDLSWPGQVVRAEGKLDERTRMVNVVVRVNQPYERKPPLAVGLFVSVEIEGRPLAGAALIPRPALRQGNVVWVVDGENRLYFRPVDVARIEGSQVLIRSGLENGDRIVVSQLKIVTDGMAVRTASKTESNPS
jgi:RND family efflux transporter MFP subunit